MKLPALLTALVVASFAPACAPTPESLAGEGVAPTIYFTAIPDQDATELLERFAPLAAWLGEQQGAPVEFLSSSDYQASVELFKSGDVLLAWFGGLTGVQACAAVPGARPIAMGVVDPKFRSYFVAHADTGIERGELFPETLRGLSFTFGSESSTSGRLMPEHFIREHTGQSPAEFFGRASAFSGSHDRTAKLVEAGSFEAGALNFRTYDRMVADGELDPERCRIVWETPHYADYSWTAHPELDRIHGAGTIDRLQAALAGLQDPELLRALDRPEGLIEAGAQDFAGLAALASELGFL